PAGPASREPLAPNDGETPDLLKFRLTPGAIFMRRKKRNPMGPNPFYFGQLLAITLSVFAQRHVARIKRSMVIYRVTARPESARSKGHQPGR
ncbi:MAG: hypothetical protein R6U98_09090, partial [Pirellulaceae bacterium]